MKPYRHFKLFHYGPPDFTTSLHPELSGFWCASVNFWNLWPDGTLHRSTRHKDGTWAGWFPTEADAKAAVDRFWGQVSVRPV